MATKADLEWTFGLINHAGTYLTCETFGGKLNCVTKSMKKKQIFSLETSEGSDVVRFRTHLGTYLGVDIDGKVSANADEAKVDNQFVIEPQKDGRWAIRSNEHGFYFGGSGEGLTAFVKEISEDRLWSMHLAQHPMVTLYNVKRKAFVHLPEDGEGLTADEIVAWGPDAVISIVFNPANGSYSIQGANGMYLTASGALIADNSDVSSHFVLEIHGGRVSFKTWSADTHKYLTCLGSQGLCKATKATRTDDETFEMRNAYPQITLKSANGKYVSIQGGIEPSANQKSASTDKEIFQMEPLGGDQFQLMGLTMTGKDAQAKYFHAGPDTESGHAGEDGVHVNTLELGANTTFNVEFSGEAGVNYIAFKASNGKYLAQQMNGYLKAKADEASADAKSVFEFSIVNRPRIAFRTTRGFARTMESGLIEINKSFPDVYSLEGADGKFAVLDQSGKYWTVGDNLNTSAASDSPQYFYVELYQNSRLSLRTEGGKYLRVDQSGPLVANGTNGADPDCQFEY